MKEKSWKRQQRTGVGFILLISEFWHDNLVGEDLTKTKAPFHVLSVPVFDLMICLFVRINNIHAVFY